MNSPSSQRQSVAHRSAEAGRAGTSRDGNNPPDLRDFRRKVTIIAAVVTVIGLLFLLLAATLNIIPLIFIAVLIAVFLRSLADPLSKRVPVAGRWMVVIVLLALLAVAGVFVAVAGPSITEQFDQLVQRIPQAFNQTEEWLSQYEWGENLLDELEQVQVPQAGLDVFSRLTGIFSGAFSVLTYTVLVLVAGVYLAFEPQMYITGLVSLFPEQRRARTREVLDESYDILRRWLIARLISMLVVAVLTFIGLMIINMPLALTLAVIAGILSFIPNLGPILAAVPAMLVGFTQSLTLALLVAVVYFIVQQIENYLITPNVQRQTVSLPPALVLLSQAFLTLLLGWLGLFIAAPLVAFILVLVKSVYVEDVLGDDVGSIVESV